MDLNRAHPPRDTRRAKGYRRLCRSSAALCVVAALACETITQPTFPTGAVAFAAHPQYAFWWQLTEACSGLTGYLESIRWYTIPKVEQYTVGSDSEIAGTWWTTTNRILLAGQSQDDGAVVRHEMLHALSRTPGHPADLFLKRCGGVVECSRACARDAGPLPDPPADAEVLAPADLVLNFQVTPTVLTDVETGG